MDHYIKKLRQHIADNPILFDNPCDSPALDSLYWHYSECHYMRNARTEDTDQALNDCLCKLTIEENNQVFSLVSTLCAEHERIAFFSGLRLGAQLMLELKEN